MAEPDPTGGRLVANFMHFARALRAAGLPVGPGQVIDAVQAVRAIGLGQRNDFYWTLHAVFVKRRDQRDIFDQTFHLFWRNPQLLERMMSLVLPAMPMPDQAEQAADLSRRVAEAFGASAEPVETETRELEIDSRGTASAAELLQEMDFESMSTDEIALAKRAVRTLALPLAAVRTRRSRRDPRGARVAMRASLRAALRSGGDIIPLVRKAPRKRPPPLVVLCDISGSMSRYSRMLLHFLHALTNDRDRVHVLLFGTRLTNVTRHLRQRDVDRALDSVGGAVADWGGGTRIGPSVRRFNREWGRRVLAQGAIVLLISDGLERDDPAMLGTEIERLSRSCRRLVWLNPLLRWDGFEPRAQGVRAILPHVDEFRPVHNLKSLAELAAALSDRSDPNSRSRPPWPTTMAA